MDLRQLGYFVAVVDHGTFSGAARSLYLSQPGLSLAVKDLEKELGTPLLLRLGRRVVPTPAGEALLGPARQALRDVETGRAAVAAVAGVAAGSLAVACLPTLAADPLAALVGAFRRAHPDVRIEVAAPEDSADLHGLVRTGRSELAMDDEQDRPGDLAAVAVAEHPLVAVHPPGTALTGRGRLGGLVGRPLVATPEGTSSRRLLEAGFADAGASPTVAVVTAQRDAILPLVLAGAGSALVPRSLATAAQAQGAVLGMPQPPIVRRVSLLHRRGPLAPAARRFVELAQAPTPQVSIGA